MKDKINLLFFKDINIFLGCEEFKYLVKQENDEIIITPIPIVLNEYSNLLRERLCYDYDLLSEMNQLRFKEQYKSFIKIKDNIYKSDIKIYKMKKNT